MSTLVDLARRAAERHGERPAVIGPKQTLTYAELAEAAGRVAAGLAALGVGPGDPVAIAELKSAAQIAAVYGILERGAAYVPIDPKWPARRAAAIVEARGVEVAVAPEGTIDGWRASTDAGLRGAAAAELVSSDAAPAAPVEIDPEAIAYILHTSGSTGAPKGVPLSHRNSRAFVDAAVEHWSIAETDRLAAQAPLHFDLSVFDLFCAAAAGAAVVLVPERFAVFPKKIAELIERERVTVWSSVVSTLLLLSERGKIETFDTSSLRAVIFSGEPMPMAGLARLRSGLPSASFFNVYGQTEANSSLCFPVDELAEGAEVLPIGRPLPGFDVFAIDESGAEIEPGGATGELYVAAGTVGTGYLGDPEKTSERYVADPREPGSGAVVYRTGDRVRRDERGDFVFVGRADNLIKTRGYRVELGEIERALAAVDGVERAVVVAVPDRMITNRIAGFVTARGGHQLDAGSLAAALSDELPRYMIPDPLEIRGALPTTATGKIDRQRLISDALRDTNES